MRIQVLPDVYRGKIDEELLELAARSEQLTAEALSTLTAELTIRRLDFPKPTKAEPDESHVERIKFLILSGIHRTLNWGVSSARFTPLPREGLDLHQTLCTRHPGDLSHKGGSAE